MPGLGWLPKRLRFWDRPGARSARTALAPAARSAPRASQRTVRVAAQHGGRAHEGGFPAVLAAYDFGYVAPLGAPAVFAEQALNTSEAEPRGAACGGRHAVAAFSVLAHAGELEEETLDSQPSQPWQTESAAFPLVSGIRLEQAKPFCQVELNELLTDMDEWLLEPEAGCGSASGSEVEELVAEVDLWREFAALSSEMADLGADLARLQAAANSHNASLGELQEEVTMLLGDDEPSLTSQVAMQASPLRTEELNALAAAAAVEV